MLFNRLHRIKDLLFSRDYRRVLTCRCLCFLLRKLNPKIVYLGLADGSETTFLFLSDNVVTPYTIAVDGFQKTDLERVLAACRKYKRLSGDYFIDVGANIGTSTLYAMQSGHFKHAISIEPSPQNIAILRLNMFANNLLNTVYIKNLGVSDHKGTMDLNISSANCGDHRLGTSPDETKGERVAVGVDTLDGILASEGLLNGQVGLVWVDTQGHEGYVLDGATSLISGDVPFFIEFWPQALSQAGCYERLLTTLETKFESFMEFGFNNSEELMPISKIRDFAKRFEGTVYFTDILIFPKR